MKLLIVEDDLLLQEGLAMALTAEGYTLDCAGTAAEADGLISILACRKKMELPCSASGVVAG